MIVLRKYGTGTGADVMVPLVKAGETDHSAPADWSPSAGDVKISKDGAASANIATLPTAVTMANGAAWWKFTFSDAELQCARLDVSVVDAATKALEDDGLKIETYGHASAQHAFDLDVATQGVNVTQVSGDSGAADNLEADYDGTGYNKANSTIGTASTLSDATIPNLIAALNDLSVQEVWDRLLTGGTHNINNSAGKRLRQLLEAGSYANAAVWVDTINGTAGTIAFENGVELLPVDSMADANTLAAAVGGGLSHFEIAVNSVITFAASQQNQLFRGDNWTLALGGQAIGGTSFFGADVSGIGTGDDVEYHHCKFGNATVDISDWHQCQFTGTVIINKAGDYMCEDGASQVAGAAAPTFDLNGVGSTTVSFRRWSGGMNLINVAVGDVISVDVVSGGIIDINGTGGTVEVRGMCKVTDSSGGAVSIVQTQAISNTSINAEVDTALNTAIPGSPTADSVNQRLKAIDVLTEASGAGDLAAMLVAALAIKTKTDNLPGAIPRGVEATFPFKMVDITDGYTPEPGLTPTMAVKKDGGAFVTCENAADEVANGVYDITLTATEMTATSIVIRATDAESRTVEIAFRTSA
jgi:hypothetical protein